MSRPGDRVPLRIDVHTHIMPESLPDLKERYGYPGWIRLERSTCGKRARMVRDDGVPFRDVEDSLWSVSRRLADMSACDIDVHVLSHVPVLFSYWAKGGDAADFSRHLNDHLAATVARAPDRFVGLGTLPMQAPALAVAELKRCMTIGLSGVQIGTHVGEWGLDHPALFPVFAAAEEVGAAVFIHPWDMMPGSQPIMSKYFLPWLVGMPAETSLAMCSLMMGGVLERLPRLRVCFAHGGGAFPSSLGRISHGWAVRPDLCAVDATISPADLVASRRVWVDSLVHDAATLDGIVKTFGAERVSLGSDYPFPLGEYTAESRGTAYAAGSLVDEMSRRPDLWGAGWAPGGDIREAVLGGAALSWLGEERAADVRKSCRTGVTSKA